MVISRFWKGQNKQCPLLVLRMLYLYIAPHFSHVVGRNMPSESVMRAFGAAFHIEMLVKQTHPNYGT